LNPPPPPTAATARLRRSAFSALIGRGFRATGKDVSQRLVLLEVADLGVMPRLPKAQRAEYREKSFAVRFSTTRAIPAGTYTLTNPRFGSHRVFLSPVDQRSEHLVEAVFNRYKG
jgi:hypothetical protein